MKGRALPSGVFIEARRVTWLDVIVARRSTMGCPDLYSTFLLSRVATFDGEKLEPDELLALDYSDISVALDLVNSMMAGPVTAKDLVQQLAASVLGRAKTKEEGKT